MRQQHSQCYVICYFSKDIVNSMFEQCAQRGREVIFPELEELFVAELLISKNLIRDSNLNKI